MSVADLLWRESEELAAAALAHPFVRGIADGTLARDRYAAYIAQDAVFLEAFARAYALALAHCPDRTGVEAFAALIGGVREELRLHDGVAARWGIDMAKVRPSSATLAYTEFLLATATIADTGTTCAAMTPCMRLYAHLGRSLADTTEPEPPPDPDNPVASYREWIDAYASDEFEQLAATMEGLLDRYVSDPAAVRDVYRRAMRLELAFFDAAAGR